MLSNAGIKKKMEKLDMMQQKMDNLASRTENMKKITDMEKSLDWQVEKFDQHESDIAKIPTENKKLKKQNTIINRSLKELQDELDLKNNKRNQLKQYGGREMLEISGVTVLQD